MGAVNLTFPKPISTVDLSEDSTVWSSRVKEMCTPVVLEKPGFDACPPLFTAQGARWSAM